MTDSNVTVGYVQRMARDRSDLRWQHLDATWKRLLWARETHGAYRSAASFARAIGLGEHAYKAYERDPDNSSKASTLDYDYAVRWADMLDVRWEWLLNRTGVPWRDEGPKNFSPEATGVAERLDSLPEDQRKAKAEAIKALLTGT